jgi:hypothetical protein
MLVPENIKSLNGVKITEYIISDLTPNGILKLSDTQVSEDGIVSFRISFSTHPSDVSDYILKKEQEAQTTESVQLWQNKKKNTWESRRGHRGCFWKY